MTSPNQLNVNTNFDPQAGTPVSIAPGIVRVTAPNASPYTFTGTNSFVLGTGDHVAVLDPGPKDDAHLEALAGALEGRKLEAILLTHTHLDHSAAAQTLSDRFDAPIWFGGPHRLSRPLGPGEANPLQGACDWDLQPERTLAAEERFAFGDLELVTIPTPGHCVNHLSFGVAGTPFLFSGDHVMGWSSTLVATPDGSISDYFASLDRLLALSFDHYLPAHGGAIDPAKTHVRRLKVHREYRNRQIIEALGMRPQTADALVDLIYLGLPAANRGAALMTVEAHLEYLSAKGRVTPQRANQDQVFALS